MRGSCELGGSATPGRERRERDERAAVQRQLHDLLVLDDRAEAGGLGAQHLRVGRHRDLLADAADGELEVDARLLAGRQVNAARRTGLNPASSTSMR